MTPIYGSLGCSHLGVDTRAARRGLRRAWRPLRTDPSWQLDANKVADSGASKYGNVGQHIWSPFENMMETCLPATQK